jgi:hypothetical protein
MSKMDSVDEKVPATTPEAIDESVRPTASDQDDVALALVGEQAHDVDAAIEKRVIRKIDRFLIPAMIVGYGMVYYDKVSLLSSISSAPLIDI